MRPRSTVILVVALIAIGGFFAWQMAMKTNYDKLRYQMVEVPRFAIHPLDAEADDFLESVRESWDVQDRELPDSIFSEISSVTGVDESVEGVVNFHTHEIPEYSFFDHRRNAKEGVMATAMAVALPTSVDNRIYFGDGVCFIKLTGNLVEVFEDTEEGLKRTRYSIAKIGEQDAAEQPATAGESK
jgi:hypothetical protein